jgi:hypothetical protein
MRQFAIVMSLVAAAMASPEATELTQTSVDGAQWKVCGHSNATGRAGQCNCKGMIRYGARGKWSYRKSNGWKSCNNGTFGDPIRGVKHCYCQATHAHATRRNAVSGHKATPWKCYRGFGAPMRRAVNGEIECMSLDRKNCLWSGPCELKR